MVFGFFSRTSIPSPRDPPLTPSPPPPSDLHALILSIPPQTLHAYTLQHLDPSLHPSPQSLHHLAAFFAHLVPPPRLHCARCHKSFFDVENTDRSCLVPHDDDTASVERVPLAKSRDGVIYETLYACCARSVEGNGDMGPPDGWCYEGKHTTDAKRARFRADSTLQDDKLTPCHRLGCHLSPPRKRGRPLTEDDDEDDEEGEGASEESSSVSSTLSGSGSGSSSRRRKKARMHVRPPGPPPPDDTQDRPMDIDALPPPATPSPVPAHSPSPALVPPPTPNPKPRSRPAPTTKPKPKPPPTKPKPSKPKPKPLSAPKSTNDGPLVLSPPYVTQEEPEEALSRTSTRVVVSAGAGAGAVGKSKVSGAGVGATPPTLKHKSSGGGASLKSPRESPKVGVNPGGEVSRAKSTGGKRGGGSGRGRGKTLAEVAVVESSVDGERHGASRV